MEIISPNTTLNVAGLKAKLLAQRITKRPFKVNLTQEQIRTLLFASYGAEVEYRGRRLIKNPFLIENIKQVATFLTEPKGKFGIMLCGLYGNGKTTMLYAIKMLINYLNRCNVFEDKRNEVKLVDAKEVQLYAKDINQFRDLKNERLLAIEDMGREATEVLDYGNIINPVIDLLEYRYDNQLVTMITTNLTPAEIAEKYGARIADRFAEMFEMVVFKGDSYRRM